MAKTVVAMFDDFNTAEKVVRDLQNSGFARDDISLMARDQRGGERTGGAEMRGQGSQAGEGAAAGAGTGAVVGGLAGLLVGLGALAIPGIGPIIAAGPIVTTLAGAGIGAAAGGIIGALVGAGVPEEEANAYAEGVRRGGTLVMVRTSDDMAGQATAIMNRYDPIDIHSRAEYWRENKWTGFSSTGQPFNDADIEREREMWRSRRGQMTGSYSQTGGSSTTTGRERGYSGMQRDFNDYASDFRSNYDMYYGSRGRDYSFYEPGYRYGYDLANNPSYRNRKWSEIEPQARLDWERRHPGNAWDDFKDSIRHAWERVTSGGQSDTGMDTGYTATGYESGTGEDRYRDINNP